MAPPPGKGAKPAAKAPPKAKDAAPELELSAQPGTPIRIVPPELAARLNPLIIVPLRASALPDAPATRTQLDAKCSPITLRMCWPPQVRATCMCAPLSCTLASQRSVRILLLLFRLSAVMFHTHPSLPRCSPPTHKRTHTRAPCSSHPSSSWAGRGLGLR